MKPRTRRSNPRTKARGPRKETPMGFLSYAHFDDEHNRGWITDFCKALSGEVRAQTGKQFPIFQDRSDLMWGQNWLARINGALKTSTFLFPVITPNFLGSKECKRELRDFLNHERVRKRNDLVFPIYFIRCKNIDQKVCPGPLGTLVRAIKQHQMRLLLDLRFQKVDDLEVRKFLAEMATQISDAIDRIERERLGHRTKK